MLLDVLDGWMRRMSCLPPPPRAIGRAKQNKTRRTSFATRPCFFQFSLRKLEYLCTVKGSSSSSSSSSSRTTIELPDFLTKQAILSGIPHYGYATTRTGQGSKETNLVMFPGERPSTNHAWERSQISQKELDRRSDSDLNGRQVGSSRVLQG